MEDQSKDKIIVRPGFWRRFFAWCLIILGIAGIILPVLPGWPFFFLGIFILAGDNATKEKIIGWFPKKSRPSVKRYFDAIYEQKNKADIRRRERADRKRLQNSSRS